MESAGHEGSHAFLGCFEVVRFAEPVRQTIDPTRAAERKHQGAGDEVVAPKQVFARTVGQGLFQQANQAQDNLIKVEIEELCAIGRV